MVAAGHFMAEEIADKVASLNEGWRQLRTCATARAAIYQRNLDLRRFLRDAGAVEAWLEASSHTLKEEEVGSSIAEAEELLRRHNDFVAAIEAQDERLDSVRRITMVEADFASMKEREEDERSREEARKEAERLEEIKRREVARITEQRRKEDSRRRTQEIKFTKEEMEAYRAREDQQRLEVPSPALARSPSYSSVGPFKRGASARGGEAPFKSPLPALDLKRAESMRFDSALKKARRTPSFTTRRRTQSFRKGAAPPLPPVELRGALERKQETMAGGKRATVRSWKTFYTVLCGQLMCFFRDEEDFEAQKAASPPVSIRAATVAAATDYTKKRHVFRLITSDTAEYLLAAETEAAMRDWVAKCSFHASLPPQLQLMSYDTAQERSHSNSTSSGEAPPSGRSSPGAGREAEEANRGQEGASREQEGANREQEGGHPPPAPPRNGVDHHSPIYQNTLPQDLRHSYHGNGVRRNSAEIPSGASLDDVDRAGAQQVERRSTATLPHSSNRHSAAPVLEASAAPEAKQRKGVKGLFSKFRGS